MLLPLWGPPPVSLMFLSLGPSRSRSPIPSLAPSWWSPCPILRRASMSISCCVLRVPSAFLCIGLVCRSRSLCRPSHAVSSMAVSILCAWSLLRLGRLTMRWVPLEPIGFEVAPPISPGQSPQSWRPPLGAQVGVSYFYLHAFPHVFIGDRFFCLTALCMSQPKMFSEVVLFGHMPCRVTGLPSGSLLALPGLCR